MAITLFLILPGGLAALSLTQVLRWMEASAALGEREAQIARLDARLAGVERATTVRPIERGSAFIQAPTASLARAELQQNLAAVTTQARGRILEMRIEDEPTGSETRSILAYAAIETRTDAVLDLLTALEHHRPLLDVERLTIRTTSGSGSDEGDPTLRVSLVVRGFHRDTNP